MHTSIKPLFLFYITFFLGISSFLYTAEARLLHGCIVEVECKESMVMRSYQRRYSSPPPPPKTSPSSPEMRTPPTALSSMKPLLSAQVASS
ncbi:hypothetical protein AAC387_Pa03g0287 [Persea americana]